MGHSADLTSTLSIQMSNIENGTNVSCLTFSESKSIIILKEGALVFITFKCHYCSLLCLQLPLHLLM